MVETIPVSDATPEKTCEDIPDVVNRIEIEVLRSKIARVKKGNSREGVVL